MGIYIRLIEYPSQNEKEEEFFDAKNRYVVNEERYQIIEGMPYAYWLSDEYINIFKLDNLKSVAKAAIGMRTGDNERFLRKWYEVSFSNIGFGSKNAIDAKESKKKWFPYNKGGEYRKWYGNQDYLVNWEDDGYEIKENTRRVYPQLGDNLGWKISNEQYYFHNGITWTVVTSKVCFRRYDDGFIFSNSGQGVICDEGVDPEYIIALLNCKVSERALQTLSPTLGFESGYVNKIPTIYQPTDEIQELSKKCINLCRLDWDAYEYSWDFSGHPLLERNSNMGILISDKFKKWEEKCQERFDELKQNEEKINAYFLNLYGLQNEMSAEVDEESISVRKANLEREICSLISYAVGCIMGRYSLKEDGLIFAGGNWDETRYSDSFRPCEFGVLPITEDQFFEEDLCTRVIEFIKVVYGEDTLNENLKYIASALKPDSYDAPKKIIRDYLFNNFFDNHYQTYQHRPIYWQMDSGKAGGFRALLYMHRFSENTLPLVRTEFIQDLRYKYEEEMQRQKTRLEGASTTAEKNAVKKDITALDKKIVECAAYDELLNHATSSIQNYLFSLDDGVKTNYAKFLSIDGDKNSNILTVVKL